MIADRHKIEQIDGVRQDGVLRMTRDGCIARVSSYNAPD